MVLCTRCGGTDHTSKGCKLCAMCFQPGHMARDCTNETVFQSPYQKMKAAEKAAAKTETGEAAESQGAEQPASPAQSSSAKSATTPSTPKSAGAKSASGATPPKATPPKGHAKNVWSRRLPIHDTGESSSSGKANVKSSSDSNQKEKEEKTSVTSKQIGDSGENNGRTASDSDQKDKGKAIAWRVSQHENSGQGNNAQGSKSRQKENDEETALPKPNPIERNFFQPIPQGAFSYLNSIGKVPPFRTSGKDEAATIDSLKQTDWLDHWEKGRRPNFATPKNGLQVLTNHFELSNVPKIIHRYLLKQPAVAVMKARKEYRRAFIEIFNADRNEQDPLAKIFPENARWATDFEHMWSLDKLQLPNDGKSFEISIQKENGGIARDFQVTLTQDHDLLYSDVRDLSGQPPENSQAVPADPTEFSKAFNALLTRFLVACEDDLDENSSIVTQLGANRFFINRACEYLTYPNRDYKPAPTLLYLNMGYFVSVRPGNTEALLNINSASTAFYAPLMVSEFIKRKGFTRGQSVDEHFEALKRVKVKICYKRGKNSLNEVPNQIKRIQGFGESPKEQKFSRDDGSEISVQNYFANELNVRLSDTGLRCVNVGTLQRPQWIPPECIQIVPWQPAPQGLVKELTDQIIKLACRRPNVNRDLIGGKGIEALLLHHLTGSGDTSDFGINPAMLTVPALQLQTPKILSMNLSGRGVYRTNLDPRFNEWRLNKFMFLHGEPNPAKKRVAVLDLFQKQSLAPFIRTLQQTFGNKGLGFQIDVSPTAVTYSPIKEILKSHLLPCLKRIKNNQYAFAVLVLPTKNTPEFQLVKYLSDCEVGFPVFVCVAPKINPDQCSNKLEGYCNMLSLKICTRMAGPTHATEIHYSGPGRRQIFPNDTLVLGADVTHPGPGSKPGTPSIAAVVGNVDEDWMQWPGSMSIQRSRQEMIQDMEGMAAQRIKAWTSARGQNSTLRKIIYYRDGVSESQYDDVLRWEVAAIVKAHAKLFTTATSAPPNLRITVVICAKRHHVRFYNQSGSDNLPAGTVVDRGVTSPWRFDFFLQSHKCGMGTARSTHYIVVRNDIKLRAEELQQFTFRLCYVWGRANKSVSLVPPAYYADVLCERGRSYLAQWLGGTNSSSHFQRQPQESDEDFKQRIVNECRFRFWQKPCAGGGRPRGEHITGGASSNGPWHRDLDGKMFYI